jgi:hypothetical protein
MNTKPVPPQDYLTQALWIFQCLDKGYDIALIPHTEADRARLESEAKKEGLSLSNYAQDQILIALTLGKLSEDK